MTGIGRLCHTSRNEFGVIRQYFIDDQGNVTVNSIQDIEANIENNKVSANERGKRITGARKVSAQHTEDGYDD